MAVTIIPAILQEDLTSFRTELEKVWRYVPRVQVDVIDGVFAPTKTIGPEELNQIDTIVSFDIHLMVDQPENWVKRCVMGGADRVAGQVERMKEVAGFIGDAQAEGLAVGLAYDLETPLDNLKEYLPDIDFVLLMAVPLGAQGQAFDERVLEKIKEVRRLNKKVTIQVDGGLDEEKIKRCLAAEWAEEIVEGELNREVFSMEFVVGSHLFNVGNTESELAYLQALEAHG